MENVAARIVTRGDHDLTPIYHSIADAGIGLIKTWDNSKQDDLAVYGRYAMIAETEEPLIYVQDDDVVLPPESVQVLIDRWEELAEGGVTDVIVANQPEAFRHDFYSDHCLVGFGAVFHRDAFDRAMYRFANGSDEAAAVLAGSRGNEELMWWRRTCDIVFTALTPRVLVDVPYRNLPWAEDETRMYRSEGHVAERTRMLDLVRKVCDAV